MAASGGRSSRNSGTILLVEDEGSVRRFFEQVLLSDGYSVLSAASVEEALAILSRREEVIDLLLTDVVMPFMKGTELVRRARESRPTLKALLVSGYLEPRGAETQAAEVRFLEKPVSVDTLRRVIREVLGE